jgi:hypothetical protein
VHTDPVCSSGVPVGAQFSDAGQSAGPVLPHPGLTFEFIIGFVGFMLLGLVPVTSSSF